jgi:hypothetical protein
MSTQPLPDPDWKALSALLPGRIGPLSPERVYDGPKTSLYRLPGAGRGGSPVIAELCRLEVASVERTVYEEVLPPPPLTRPAYYGSAPAGPSSRSSPRSTGPWRGAGWAIKSSHQLGY